MSPWLHVGNSALRNSKTSQCYPGQCFFRWIIPEISTNQFMYLFLWGYVDQLLWQTWPPGLHQLQWHYLQGILMCSTGTNGMFSKKVSSSDFSILTRLGVSMLFSISRQVTGKQFITCHLDVKLSVFYQHFRNHLVPLRYITEISKHQFRYQLPHNKLLSI